MTPFPKRAARASEQMTGAHRVERQTSRRRRDANSIKWTPRDQVALRWIGEQYAIRLDHLQWLLGREPGQGAARTDWIGEGAARAVVTRWEKAEWAQRQRRGQLLRQPFWLWPTQRALHSLSLPYRYQSVENTRLHDLEHLYAINEIRLHVGDYQEGTEWISERQLLAGVAHHKGEALLHRPDGVLHSADGTRIAIEAELSMKRLADLEENLIETLRGQAYLSAKAQSGISLARASTQGIESLYSEMWYYAPPKVRKHLRRARAKLVARGDLSAQEAERLHVWWYPLACTDEETAQEEQEEEEALSLELESEGGQEDEPEPQDEAHRPFAQDEGRELE